MRAIVLCWTLRMNLMLAQTRLNCRCRKANESFAINITRAAAAGEKTDLMRDWQPSAHAHNSERSFHHCLIDCSEQMTDTDGRSSAASDIKRIYRTPLSTNINQWLDRQRDIGLEQRNACIRFPQSLPQSVGHLFTNKQVENDTRQLTLNSSHDERTSLLVIRMFRTDLK